MEENVLREELVQYGKKLIDRNLVIGAGGNISARCGSQMLISPSGLGFDEIGPADYIAVDIPSGHVLSPGRPSSELLMHWYCYRAREDIQAVVHAHPPYTIGVMAGGGFIEPMYPEFAAYIGHLGKIDYIIPCTEDLARAIREQIESYSGVLMVAHGALAVGRNLKEAFFRMELIEESAKVLAVASVFGKPRVLNDQEIQAIKNLDAERYRVDLMKDGHL